VSNGVVNYLVRINLDPTEAALRTNMTANARIILDTHSNVLAVPGGAIRQDATGYYVNVVGTDGTAQRVDVTTGYTDGDLTEVAGNLQAGQQVYISEPTTTNTSSKAQVSTCSACASAGKDSLGVSFRQARPDASRRTGREARGAEESRISCGKIEILHSRRSFRMTNRETF